MTYAIPQRKISDNAYINKKALFIIVFLAILLIAFPVYAEEFGDSLTDLFQTKVFKGSWEFVTEFGWIAGVMNWIISAFSFIGLCLVMVARITSILYLTNRALFDNVYDIKSAGKGQEFFGLKSLLTDTWNSKYDTGADSIVSFFLGLLPNIKRYSDYNPENPNPAIDENDNVLNYMLKMLGPTVLIMVFLTMGYGGQLGKMYGMVVDGIMVVVDEFVNYRLDDFIDDTIHVGENYNFTLGNDGSSQGKVKEKIAKGIYKTVANKYPLSTEQKSVIGRAIEDLVTGAVNPSSVSAFLPAGSSLDLSQDNAWDAISIDVIMNSNPTANGAIMTVDLKSHLGFTGEGSSYVHVFVTQSGNAGQDFFQP